MIGVKDAKGYSAEGISIVSIDPDANTITFTAEHFGLFAVVGQRRPRACRRLNAPRVEIEAALENPSSVSGWGHLCNDGRPYDPLNNTYRVDLNLQNPNVPYNPMGNTFVFKCGCR